MQPPIPNGNRTLSTKPAEEKVPTTVGNRNYTSK